MHVPRHHSRGVRRPESAVGWPGTAASNTTAMVTFPVSLILTFFVPLFVLAHTLTFRRIAGLGAPVALPRWSAPVAAGQARSTRKS
jgi:hypothetical protein